MNFNVKRHEKIYCCQQYFDNETKQHFYSIHESVYYLDNFHIKNAKIFPDWRRIKAGPFFLTLNILNKRLDEWYEGCPPKLYINRKLPNGWLNKLHVFFDIKYSINVHYHDDTGCWKTDTGIELSKYIKLVYDEEKEINVILTFKDRYSVEGYGKIHIDKPGTFKKLVETVEVMSS